MQKDRLKAYTPKSARNGRAFEHVANQLRDMLTGGKLKPGDRLPPERKLAPQFKVSRAALREALRTLEHEGVLELRHGKTGGAFVSSGNLEALSDRMSSFMRMGSLSWNDLAEVRVWIEEIIVRVACQRATIHDIRELEQNIRQARAHFERGDMRQKTDTNIEFHSILARATHNAFLVMIIQTISGILRYFTPRLSVERTREVFRSRRRFMTAFVAGDVDAAVKEMERNLKKAHRYYLRPIAAASAPPRLKARARKAPTRARA